VTHAEWWAPAELDPVDEAAIWADVCRLFEVDQNDPVALKQAIDEHRIDAMAAGRIMRLKLERAGGIGRGVVGFADALHDARSLADVMRDAENHPEKERTR
jgi:hypothetical protein